MKILTVSVLILITALVMLGCSRESTEEERIRGVIEEAAEAVRSKEIKGVMRHVSESYNDTGGNDYDSIKGLLFFRMMRPGQISVFVRVTEVQVEGRVARVEAKAFVVRGKKIESIKDIIPEEAEGLAFSIIFRLEDGEWKVLSGEWDEVGVLGLL